MTPEAEAIRSETALRTKGQRGINRIWEITQSLVALSVICATLYASVNMMADKELGKTAFVFLTNACFVVVGFYFGRTNHQKSGGVGGDAAGPRS